MKLKSNPLYTDVDINNAFDQYRKWSTNYDRLPEIEGIGG